MNASIRAIALTAVLVLGSTAVSQAGPVYATAPGYNSGGTADVGSGGMYMLNVYFAAAKDANGIVTGGALSMAAQARTIILAQRPAGSFDPNAAWGVLDGTAYSRRLGWNPDPNKSLADIPAGDSIWIELVSASPEVKCYYAQDANSAISANPITQTYTYYGGMFGTAGSNTKWQWDQKMDHNANAVDLASVQVGSPQTFTATYKLYIGDSSGNEILNPDLTPTFTSTTEVWTWNVPAVPEPATLTILAAGALLALRRRRRR